MSNIALTESQIQQFSEINKFFETNGPRLSEILTFDNLINEAHALNTIESNIPESLRFDLHLDLIFNRGVTDYYKLMSSGENRILEAARKVFPNSQHITESIESFKAYLISMLNESGLELGMPSDGAAALSAPLEPRKSDGIWGTLKSLWNAITEGGSVIGIIHFIIDIIGLVGDFIFPGVGVVADIINAIIYAVRGEWIQCSISVIAAIVIGGGDALKLVRYAAKPGQRVLAACAKEGGAKAAAEIIAKLPAKEGGGVVKLLTGIFGNIGGALGKATSLLGMFIQKFGDNRLVRLFPGLSAALKPIFDGLGTVITSFGKKMSLASANFKLATKSAKKAAAVNIETSLRAGGDFVFDGPWVKVLNKEGKQIGKYPVKQFDKIAGEALINATAKKAGSKEGAEILFKEGSDVARVNNVLTNPKLQEGMRKRAYNYFETTALKKGWKRMVSPKNLAFFVGKQIYKIIFKSDWLDGPGSQWSPGEVAGHGNGAINDWIDDRMGDKKNKTLLLDSQDQEVVDRITDYQNHFAEITGEPRIINVVTNKLEKEGPAEEFEDFFNEVAKGKVTRGEKGDMVDHTVSDKLAADTKITESRKSIVRTISNFSDFK